MVLLHGGLKENSTKYQSYRDSQVKEYLCERTVGLVDGIFENEHEQPRDDATVRLPRRVWLRYW